MSKFTEKKKAIAEAAKASSRKTFNEQQFNELGTALLNEMDYTTKVAVVEGGKFTEQEITPVKDFRKSVIGGILKSAGHDAAECEKFVNDYNFSTIPLYPVVSEMVEQYVDAGKTFKFQTKSDFEASILIENQDEEIKDVKAPGSDVTTKTKYGPFRKMKAKSTCPSNLKTKL